MDQQTMLTLGRLTALAASVERATRQEEHTRQLDERVGLVRDIHERVMQRLFGLTLVLGSGETLARDDLRACHDELQIALRDLRSALARPISEHERRPQTTLRELVERRAQRTPQLEVSWESGVEVPGTLEELAQAVFLEALRNCEKHASPRRIEVRVGRGDTAFELEVTNDGLRDAGGGGGIGLRMLTLEALQQDALVEFGRLPDARWHVRMVGSTS
jgi:signal transduction histidine kinase